MKKTEAFKNRWGIVLASLGMAIGAGNLWRFPRLAGQYGGSFILLWIFFLFVWSIPLLLSEFAIGKKFKKGVIGSYASFAGKRYTFLGFFITFCTLGIAFYYATVTAWALRYLSLSVSFAYESWLGSYTMKQQLTNDTGFLDAFWHSISSGNVQTIIIFVSVLFIAVRLLSRGVNKGLALANKILIPTLFVLMLIIVSVVLNMENGYKGLEYMFGVDWSSFENPTIWIEAMSQSAWSTGAGWGLMMTLSSYSRTKEDVSLNTFIGAFGNNTASLLAGMAILPAVFALAATDQEAIAFLKSGNQALTFTIIPKLFSEMTGGELLCIFFFLTLSIAAFSSLLPMIELLKKNVKDLGFNKNKSFYIVFAIFVVLGLPSCWSLDVFNNQDWVWGIGLIVNGLLILFAVAKNGIFYFKTLWIDQDSQMKISNLYFKWAIWINIPLAILLIIWWLSQGYSSNTWFDENGVWNVWDVYSNASVLTQWALVLVIGLILNKYLYKKFAKP